MANDNPLLICQTIAMTKREVSIVQALATKQVVQCGIPGCLKRRGLVTGSGNQRRCLSGKVCMDVVRTLRAEKLLAVILLVIK